MQFGLSDAAAGQCTSMSIPIILYASGAQVLKKNKNHLVLLCLMPLAQQVLFSFAMNVLCVIFAVCSSDFWLFAGSAVSKLVGSLQQPPSVDEASSSGESSPSLTAGPFQTHKQAHPHASYTFTLSAIAAAMLHHQQVS